MVLITTVNFELEVEHFAKRNIKFVFVAVVLFFAFSQGKVPVEKFCFMKGKTREKFVCEGRLVALNVEMARVAIYNGGARKFRLRVSLASFACALSVPRQPFFD